MHWIVTKDSDYKLSPQKLDNYCREKKLNKSILIINYPGNPTGQSYNEDELKALAMISRKHQLLVILDEIYGKLHFDGSYKTISRFYPEGTIISTGLSKWCGAGAWRLGIMYIPTELDSILKIMKQIGSETFSAVSAPIQNAAITVYKYSSALEAYVNTSRVVLQFVAYNCKTRLK